MCLQDSLWFPAVSTQYENVLADFFSLLELCYPSHRTNSGQVQFDLNVLHCITSLRCMSVPCGLVTLSYTESLRRPHCHRERERMSDVLLL